MFVANSFSLHSSSSSLCYFYEMVLFVVLDLVLFLSSVRGTIQMGPSHSTLKATTLQSILLIMVPRSIMGSC